MALVEPESRGDPESPLQWTCLSTRNLAGTLTAAGHACSAPTAARLLKAEGYSLQGNAKVAEGRQHPDRDAQFRYIARTAREHLDAGQPVVSVDAKKKEKIGNFANGGSEWRPQGHPERVNVHDFPSDAIGKAIPYGIYDLGANTGWVSVGTDHDTSAFAAATLRRWWRCDGSARYPGARRLLICADSGGSNATRARAWKVELARLAAETGLQVTCCHYPPGTSKWNKVEHRLFAQITRNWRGRPLTSHQAVVELISATTTTTGLTVTAELDTSKYPTGLLYTKKQVNALPIDYHGFHDDWNYTVRPEPTKHPSLPGSRRHARGKLSYLFSIAKLRGEAQVQVNYDVQQILVISAIALAVIAVAAASIGWIIAGRVLRPLSTITAAARRIAASSLHERLGLHGPDDELKELADTLDDLFARLEASFDVQRRFAANASHELRTPLTRERTLLQVTLADPASTTATWQGVSRELLASNAEQERLIEALLTLADSEGSTGEREPLDLAAITGEALAAARPAVGRLGLHVQTDIQPAILDGDPLLVQQLVNNLIDNAVRHNIPGGNIQITTKTS